MSKIHLPTATVLASYLGVVLGVVHDHPEWSATLSGKLGAAGVVAVPVALAFLDSLVKKPRDTVAAPDTPPSSMGG